jgi:hypothetical protein
MGKCIHYMKDSTFTLCGVSTAEKKGAKGTTTEEGVTCNNCLKLLHGGQMGAPPPNPTNTSTPTTNTCAEKKEEGLEEVAVRNNLMLMEGMSSRIYSMEMSLKVCLSYIPDESTLMSLIEFQEYLDAAHVRIKWAIQSLRGYIMEGDE